jgi:hypothetical protein
MLLLHIAQNADAIIHVAHTIPAIVHHPLQPLACPTGVTNCTVTTTDGTGNGYQDIVNFATNIMSTLRILAIVVFFISITVAGMMRMMSFGGQQRIMISNMALTSAIIGLVIVAISFVLQSLIQAAFK